MHLSVHFAFLWSWKLEKGETMYVNINLEVSTLTFFTDGVFGVHMLIDIVSFAADAPIQGYKFCGLHI